MSGDPNPAQLFLRQGGTTAITSSDVTYMVTIELGSPTATPRLRDAVASAPGWHMKRNGVASHVADGIDSSITHIWGSEHVTGHLGQRETHMHFRCKPGSVEAVRQLAADAIKSVLVRSGK